MAGDLSQDPDRFSGTGRTIESSTLPDGRRVVDIDFRQEDITREDVEGLRKYPNLRRLYVGCGIDDDARRNVRWPIGIPLRQWPFGESFPDEFVAILAEFQQLEILDLSGTEVTDKGLNVLARLPRLSALGLQCTGTGGNGLLALKQLPRLEILDVRCTNLDEVGLDALSQLPKLRVLMMGAETIRDELVATIPKKLPKLRVLRLETSKVTDEGLRHLARMRELEELRLTGSKAITETGLKHLVSMKGLKRLDLEFTDFGDEVVDTLIEMPDLEYVRLTFTRVSQQGADRLRAKRPKLKVDWTPGQRIKHVRFPELTRNNGADRR